MAYAAIDDLEQLWRPLTDIERSRATALMDSAAVRIDVAAPLPDGREPTELELAVRREVSCEMVKRAMLADLDQPPLTQVQISAGPFQHSGTFVNPTGALYLTREDKKLLGIGKQRAFMVVPQTAEDRVPGW